MNGLNREFFFSAFIVVVVGPIEWCWARPKKKIGRLVFFLNNDWLGHSARTVLCSSRQKMVLYPSFFFSFQKKKYSSAIFLEIIKIYWRYF